MDKQSILSKINPLASCKRYGVSFWQCPQSLFLIMGLIIVGAIIAAYLVGTQRIGDPSLVSLFVLLVGAVLLVLNFVITNSFERMAEASRMKTEFINIVSHQLRAPLTNIIFSLDFLFSDKLEQVSQNQAEYLVIIKENSKRMSSLIDKLLTVSRMEKGSFPMNKKLVSLEVITSKLLEKFKPMIEASNIEVRLKAPSILPKVLADPLWLEQVVENLLDNAIRYSKGGGRVELKIEQKKSKLYFEIKDSGVGIPKIEQKHIFSRFFRSKNALKKQTQGSGLGLHISKRIVELLGGKISFRSKEHKGATFWFSLPVNN